MSSPRPQCPSCQGRDTDKLKDEAQIAVCRRCSRSKRSVFRFCSACQREWPRDASLAMSCSLPNCALRAALLSEKLITDPKSSVMGCPFFRACITCKALLTHSGEGCPNIQCPHCNTEFCFRCLQRQCFGEGFYAFLLFRHRMDAFPGLDIKPCAIQGNKQSLSDL